MVSIEGLRQYYVHETKLVHESDWAVYVKGPIIKEIMRQVVSSAKAQRQAVYANARASLDHPAMAALQKMWKKCNGTHLLSICVYVPAPSVTGKVQKLVQPKQQHLKELRELMVEAKINQQPSENTTVCSHLPSILCHAFSPQMDVWVWACALRVVIGPETHQWPRMFPPIIGKIMLHCHTPQNMSDNLCR